MNLIDRWIAAYRELSTQIWRCLDAFVMGEENVTELEQIERMMKERDHLVAQLKHIPMEAEDLAALKRTMVELMDQDQRIELRMRGIRDENRTAYFKIQNQKKQMNKYQQGSYNPSIIFDHKK